MAHHENTIRRSASGLSVLPLRLKLKTPHIRLPLWLVFLLVSALESLTIVAGSILAINIYRGDFLLSLADPRSALLLGSCMATFYVTIAYSTALYEIPTLVNPDRSRKTFIYAWSTATLLICAVSFFLKPEGLYPRVSIITFALFGLLALYVLRIAAASALRHLLDHDRIRGRNVVIVGERDELDRLSASTLLRQFCFNEVARFTFGLDERLPLRLDIIDRAIAAARDQHAEELILAMKWNAARLRIVASRLARSPLSVKLLRDASLPRSIGGEYDCANSRLFVQLQRSPMSLGQRAIKRALDVVGAAICIIILSPVLLITALLIKLDSAGPVIFKQRRNGRNDREFVIFKFRTMKVLEDGQNIVQASQGDRRVTKIGRVLRSASLDELPQLFNVLKGDMSLVGPRPHALAHDTQYKSLISNYAVRLHVKPGITGLAQVNKLRGETAHFRKMKERVIFDQWYIRNWSIWLDLWILIRTPIEVLKGDAY